MMRVKVFWLMFDFFFRFHFVNMSEYVQRKSNTHEIYDDIDFISFRLFST